MDKNLFESQWAQLRGVIRDKWSNLSEEDLREINGQYDSFVNKIQQKYGLSKEEVQEQLNNWSLERGFTGEHEVDVSRNSSYKWLVLAGIPILLAAGYFLHDLSREPMRTYAKPAGMVQNMPYAQAKDSMLKTKLTEAIQSGSFSFADITIDSSNGIVTLRGQVSSQEQKDGIANIIEKFPGVNKVENQIEVEQ